ncbi:MAG: HD-GYP domain-containing protein [Candidatus Aminicenantia bacterium]
MDLNFFERIGTSETKNGYHKKVIKLILQLVNIVEKREQYTVGHSERVAYYARKMAAQIGFSEKDLINLELAGKFHDVGKMAISDFILQKKGPLEVNEWLEVKQHPVTGVELIKPFEFLNPIVPLIKYHHERWDGTGYPECLKGKEIPLGARILAVVDTFDALSCNRSYRRKMSDQEIYSIIKENANIRFDPEIVSVFLEIIKDYAN